MTNFEKFRGHKLSRKGSKTAKSTKVSSFKCMKGLRYLNVCLEGKRLDKKTKVNDTHREKLFYSIQYKDVWLAASNLFHMFTQSVKFQYTFHYYALRVQMFEK